ncbi:hypothetical protein FJV41_26765 [Myxococcus llanfairpwllgwyngyllgogerychwyrndrobwllllantysiliogogogochensis]|uniref:Uncharacterized protein n=1 Tax=Myxococcus llanfairpwllgwyngyllgogerychwyrndrobwllllantysiliogogogochensis TaxID=2590453 RepID=A0A540WV48_9BACT|nr:hypothetical protein [Myxococcus llanfairpwllgwyngyllgogerychwyrndrobwllllantysiliogogogochensis]TQF12883.1 hypothetical protein FJV41_26765 [Myxococcus llanfairpwllgwyngyllgogerychwyrndrobwllllantysiliogogogochensis]
MHEADFERGFRNAPRLMALVLAALFIPGPRAQAYPIPPETLWGLTEEAEWVVWADVEEAWPLPEDERERAQKEDWESGHVARLRVREAWKGNARQGEQLEVHWIELACPAPARFEKGLAVVAFLTHRAGKWRAVAKSYGTRYPASNDDLEAYRRAVTLARNAHEKWTQERIVGRGGNLEAARVDWQVRVSAHPATRWDGLYGLVPEGDSARAFYDGRVRTPVVLTGAQREQLARGFVERPPLDRALPMMLKALRGHSDKEVDLMAARALETALTLDGPPGWVPRAFSLLRERFGEKLPPRRAPTQEELMTRMLRDGLSGPSHEELEGFIEEWTRFKQRHQLTPALLPLPVEPPVPGTGGDSPL